MFSKGTILCLIIFLHVHQCLNLCIEHERRSLLNIEKDIFDPDNWLSSWRKGGDCCNWQGIICHNTTGHVVSLDLHYPYDWPSDDLSFRNGKQPDKSKLNPSLFDLKHLTYLDLSYNNFSEALIPIFIGSLTRLEYLDLSSSGFQGTIPPQLGNLSRLQVLSIDNSEWDTPYELRIDDLHWLSRLTSLIHLKIGSVNLSTATDWIHDVSKLPFITTISFKDGFLPSIPMAMPPSNSFTFLQTLDLDNNFLNSTIPGWLLNNINSLESLSLSDCGLYGELPPLYGQVSNLKFLNLRGNQFDGEVFLHLDKLLLLEGLNLEYNNINASISEILWNLRNLTHLTSLNLSQNKIHGSLPKTLGNYNKLKTLMISMNNIAGEIPPSIGDLFRLTELYLDYNNIGGEIPSSLGNLSMLSGLSLRSNNIGGEIPRSIGNLSWLTHLYLDHNNIEGRITNSIGNLKKLASFGASTNLLNGVIPQSLFKLTNLSFLDLSNNNFWGEVPNPVNLNNLNEVDFSNNRLYGSIFFSNHPLLQRLDLSNNLFAGMLPIPISMKSPLLFVNLSNNSFSGTIPDLFMFYPFLISLNLGKNNLNGIIPSSLKYCKLLKFLDLSENKLGGKIPPWIGGTLLSLKVLSLRSNNFTGQIPKELSCLTSLQILDLSHNNINGNFSLYFDNFTVMTKAEPTFSSDIYYAVNFEFPIVYVMENIWLNKQGSVRQYTKTILSDAIVIDLSRNEISGEISNGITKLVHLKFLNLSWNHFIGNIPKNIGAMKDLELLDLSSNELLGEIPSTMAEMTSLSSLNLSHNKLSGMIPVGNQFQTFVDPSIYSGNSNLCGWPLPTKCFGSNNNNTNFDGKENEEYEYWYETTWINAGTVVGFLISSWGIFITLLLNRSMRRLHLYYVDKVYGLISLQFYIGIVKIKSKIMKTEMH